MVVVVLFYVRLSGIDKVLLTELVPAYSFRCFLCRNGRNHARITWLRHDSKPLKEKIGRRRTGKEDKREEFPIFYAFSILSRRCIFALKILNIFSQKTGDFPRILFRLI